MINIKGIEYYTAKDAMQILKMKYSSVIFLLRSNNISKYKKKYIITKEEMEKLLHRENQYTKTIILNKDNLGFNHKDLIF